MPPRTRGTSSKITAKAAGRAPARAAAKTTPAGPATATKGVRFDPVKATPIQFVPDPARTPEIVAGVLGTPMPSHTFRILRPVDLVVLDVACFGLELRKDRIAALVADHDAYLVVTYPFQHLGEEAFELEGGELPHTPVRVRVANASRLVFEAPADTVIPYSIEGVLAALSRLQLRVAPLAKPRKESAADLGAVLVALAGGIGLVQTQHGVAVATMKGTPQSGGSATDRILADAGAQRVARTVAARLGAADSRGVLATGATRGAAGFQRSVGIGTVTQNPGAAFRPTTAKPRPPRPDETAIEAPYRLLISPSAQGGFTHATRPRMAPTDLGRVELWHSRLGTRSVHPDGTVTIDETTTTQRIVRAVWARDMQTAGVAPTTSDPFRMSLEATDRFMLVTESADPTHVPPEPVRADRLFLSALGAWLDLHGDWNTAEYSKHYPGVNAIQNWDHVAPMGRDQYVKVAYPGYLFPFGHRATLVKVTERRIDDATDPVAWLYQRYFLVVQEPVRTYPVEDHRDLPFTEVRLQPLITPDLVPPETGQPGVIVAKELFWPTVGTAKFEFTLETTDRDGRRSALHAPLLWVKEGYVPAPSDNDLSEIVRMLNTGMVNGSYASPHVPADGQSIALAPPAGGSTAYETNWLAFRGNPGFDTSTPSMARAQVVVPAMKHLAPTAPPVDIEYAKPYLEHGFAGVNKDSQVLAALVTPTTIKFGDGSASGTTAKAGGFVQPSLPVHGLSATLGTIGQVAASTNPADAATPVTSFDPETFLDGVLPKLFGVFSLTAIIEATPGLDQAPSFVAKQLDKIAALFDDLAAMADAITRAGSVLDDGATTFTTAFPTAYQQLTDAVDTFKKHGDVEQFTATAKNAFTTLGNLLTLLAPRLSAVPLPPLARAQLDRLSAALTELTDVAKVVDQVAHVIAFLGGNGPGDLAVRAGFEWRPRLKNYPATAGMDDALFYVDPQGFVLSVQARASGAGAAGFDVLAELSDFGLNLFGPETLLSVGIERLSFRSTDGRKPEVDVVMKQMEWLGILGFIATLEQLIPMDGFSDPPYVDVTAEGAKAGFDLALPGMAVGVFSLQNISLGADISIPFLGDAVTVGFNFCTREKPFRLTVMCVGGGGFVGLRLSPAGLVLLEMELEACAQLAIDLGVASGSVSISVGVYMRLAGEKGSLTGYFRVRGQVDVLGLISASITLELSLTYDFDSGKLVGEASVSVEIDVFMFSYSVDIRCRRQLAGANSDPSFADYLGIAAGGTAVPHPGADDGGVPHWTDYCAAFAEV